MQLKCIEQKTSNKHIEQIKIIVLSLLITLSGVVWFISAFNITVGKAGTFIGGLVRLWNGVCDCLGNSDYILLTQYEGASDGSAMFLAFMVVVFTAVNYGILRFQKSWFLVIYAVPFFAAYLLFNIIPSMYAGVTFAVILLLAVMTCLYKDSSVRWSFISIVVVVAIVTGIAVLTIDEDYSHEGLIHKVQYVTNETIENIRYGKNIRGDGNMLPENFMNDKTVLEVAMEKPEPMYLKGFTGSIYEDGKWTLLPNESYYAEKDMMYWLHKKEFSGISQISKTTEFLGKTDDGNKVSVKNVGASRQYMYYPYELKDGQLQEGKSWSDSFITSSGIRGARNYEYTVMAENVSTWPSLYVEFFNADESDTLEQYLINESHYNVMMYEDYTSLTVQQRKMLARFIGSSGDQSKEHVAYKQAIKRVKIILEDNFVYSEKKLSGDDPVESFLKKNKGSDVHFASLATLMFRYYGIPARYVEGYIITKNDAKDVEAGETIKIKASANHAWTEIYIDGFGWIPMEVTPEYYDKMELPDLSKGLESNMYSDAFKKNRKVQQQNEVDADENAEKKKTSIPWMWILIIAMAIVVATILIRAIVRGIRKHLEKKRRIQSFHNPDIKEGICTIYQYMINEKMDISENIYKIGERAAFSPHPASEEERKLMLVELEEKERERREKKNIRNSDIGNNDGRSRRLWK